MPLTEKAVPKESATVILVHQNDTGSWEVFLARRHREQSFMAGAYVFPGGQVDSADSGTRLAEYISVPDSFDPQMLLQDPLLTLEMAQSIFLCAIRETFEETGVLIAHTSDGNLLTLNSKQDIARFAVYRKELNAGRITLVDIVQKEHLLFPLNILVPYAHWITPEIVPKRFSTRFFLTRLPGGQWATTDCGELTDCLWATPKEILHMHYNKEITLMPPTLKTLDELTAYLNIDALFSGAQGRTIYPIMPQPAENILKLPHDPEYSIEKFKVPAKPEEPSRIILTDGIWRTGFCPE